MVDKPTYEELEQKVKKIEQDAMKHDHTSKMLRQYEYIISTTNDHMSFIDCNYIYQTVNNAYLKAHKITREEIIGHSVADLFGAVVFERLIKEKFDRCLNGEQINYQSWFDFPEMGQRYMDVLYNVYTGTDGQALGVVVSSRDITERKKVEETLRESIRLNELLLDSLPHPAMLINKKREVLAANKIATDGGVKIGELCWDSFGHCEYISKEHKQRFKNDPNCPKNDIFCSFCLADDLLRTDTTQNDPEVSAFGKLWDTWWVPVEKDIYLHYSIDITERKRAEEKIKEGENRWQSLTANTNDIVQILDIEGRILFQNRVYPPHELKDVIGKFVFEFTHDDFKEITQKSIDRLIAGEGPQTFENAIILSESDIAQFEVKYVPMLNNGKLDRIIATVTDIRERKQAEEEKRKVLEFAAEQSKNALIGQVAGKMAHDFNNVLAGIMGNAQLAIMDCDDENTKEKLERINEFSERGRDITNNLISFSKDQEPKQTCFRIEDKIELILKMLEKDLAGIEISRDYETRIPELLADPGMIQDVLTNLIQNSAHAMSKVENPTLKLKAYSQNDKVYFEIEDNGCGIPKEHQDSIYTPSFTLKGGHDKTGSYKSGIKGTGYGMSNVKKYIVEKHKGDISLESIVGKGTRITIALRIIRNRLSSVEKKKVVKNQIYDKRRMLIVEDEHAIADVQYQILTKEPFNHIVSAAGNGQIAIDSFEKNKFDIVSLDYMLPGNINGLHVYNYIRENDKDIPVIFISGNIEFLESIQKLKEKDPNLEHLSKPVNNLDYVNKVNELIGKSIKVKKQLERRKSKRFMPCNTAAGVIRSDSSKKYQIIDISKDGLAFRYSESSDQSIRLIESDELTIKLADVGFYLDNIPCKIISDVTLAENDPSGSVPMKRCCIQFGDLTTNQTSRLDHFIENHTIAA